MSRILFFLSIAILWASMAWSSVEIALKGEPLTVLDEVYLRDGVVYLAIDDVLPVLGLSGKWDSVEHVYRIRYAGGTAIISPGSQFIRMGESFSPLAHRPRFIDGRLRVADDFVREHLQSFVKAPIYFRNLNPSQVSPPKEESQLDRLFAFLLRKKKPEVGKPGLNGVAIDVGHGGQDTGSLGIGGIKEKDVNLAVAKRLEKLVKMRIGIPVFLSRDADYSLTWQQRFETANRPEADLLIILHSQASFSPESRGVTLLIRSREDAGEETPHGEEESLRLARSLERAFKGSDFVDEGIVRAPLLPLGRGNLPTVLVEMGYLTNAEDKALLGSPEGEEKLAEALFKGMKEYADKQKEVAR